MGDRAVSDSERLPWLDAPRAPKPTAPRATRTPLLVLLALFLASAVAVMAYLGGRSTTPALPPVPAQRSVPVVPQPAPVPPPALPAPPVQTQPPPPVVEPVRAAPVVARATRPKARKASVRKASARRATRRPARATRVDRSARRAPVQASASAAPVRPAWPARPFAGPRGRVIQLGAYTTQPQADAAWWRVARVYPHLATLPRLVTVVGPSRGRPRYYRVRLAAASNGEARALCRQLHRIGRGCIVA